MTTVNAVRADVQGATNSNLDTTRRSRIAPVSRCAFRRVPASPLTQRRAGKHQRKPDDLEDDSGGSVLPFS